MPEGRTIRLTLDTNCIIDLEEDRPDAMYIRQIVEAWRKDKISLCVVAVSASENQPGNTVSMSYDNFVAKLKAIGLEGIEALPSLMIWDVTYWDRCVWGDDKTIALLNNIRDVLHPDLKFDAPSNQDSPKIWRNKLCDVMVAWSHAHNRRDILVTRDRQFHRMASRLLAVGVKGIKCPKEAVDLIHKL